MVRLDVEEQGRNHRNGLLPRDVSNIGFVNEEVLKALEGILFPDGLPGNVELPGVALRIPAWALHMSFVKDARNDANAPFDRLGRAERNALIFDPSKERDEDGLDLLVQARGDPAPSRRR